jgi:2-keto-4-pentenoate hydratase
MALDHDTLHTLAHALMHAAEHREPIAPLTEQAPGITAEDAYAISADVMGHRIEAGVRIVGHKIGLTARAMREALGIETPDFGVILDDMTVRDGGRVSTGKLIAPLVEPEIGFRLREALRGPGVDAAAVLAATEYVFPALEIIDSRIEGWRIKEQDTIADNGSSALVVLGPGRAPASIDLNAEEAVLYRNGEEVGRGNGAEVIGGPAAAVAWCANKLAEFGLGLAAGEFIIPGSVCKAAKVAAGDEVRAVYTTLGSVGVRFA